MKLRNKKTGEIKELQEIMHEAFSVHNEKSLMNLEKEWEDYEEPKDIQCIYYVNHFDTTKIHGVIVDFETEEEAKKAVEKLKAWKRLKDKGFRFKKWKHKPLISYHYDTVRQKDGYKIFIEAYSDTLVSNMKDLDLLFGGEE